ncbi:MAG: glycoside hydrolase family 99-like domain-containing protein [Armatimonadota bacterium]|nr:glycoside hydrolase family 99-like domain-containing protein [Armatimonadota bacterium]
MMRVFGTVAYAIVIAGCASAASVKTIVGVYYFPGWHIKPPIAPLCPGGPPDRVGEWRYAIMNAAKPRPLCGFYDDSDVRLWDYYIDWMRGCGIDFIAFDWYYNARQQFLYEALDRGFLHSSKRSNMKFCLHWCNHGGNWWHKPLDQSQSALREMMDEVCHRYFHLPNYLKLDGRPVFMIYDPDTLLRFGGRQVVRESLRMLHSVAQEHGFRGVYLVAVNSSCSASYIKMLRDLGFDAFCAYTYAWMRPASVAWYSKAWPYREVTDMMCTDVYPFLRRIGNRYGIPYWPTTFSGWDDRPRAGLENAFVLTGNDPGEFGRMFRSALDNVNPRSAVVMVEAWNEWGEGACIEPSKEHGFAYLDQIARALGKSFKNPKVPTPDEIHAWSILEPDELKVACENESKPWPVKSVERIRLASNYDVPDVPMPIVFDFTASGMPLESLILNGLQVLERTDRGLLLVSNAVDPQVILPTVSIPTAQVKSITVAAQLLEKAPGNPEPPVEIYWQTGKIPEFTPYCSVKIPFEASGISTLLTEEIMTWISGGTPILRIRLDLGEHPGNKFLLKRLVLSSS